HVPDEKEVRAAGWQDNVRLVIDEWLLLEYACVFLPANQDALVEAVSKGTLDLPPSLAATIGVPLAPRVVPFTALTEIERAARRAVDEIDFDSHADRLVHEACARLAGRV